ncbi:MAG: PD40 domain-containing protein [bacterium]|nr:PD40 domain-containing protein [bacterium]
MAVLVQLASRAGEVVTRSELLEAVWGETVVQEEALTQAVSQLRRALDDDPRAPSIIETIPKQGYRLLAAVTRQPPPLPTDRPAPRRLPLVATAAAVTIIVIAVLAAGDGAHWRTRSKAVVEVPATAWREQPLTTLPGDEGWPALSPDGSLLAYAGRAPGSDAYRLQLLRMATGEALPVADGDGDRIQPAWSPDGERIAFARQDSAGWCLCVLAAMGGPVRDLGPVHWALGGHDWSPDGTVIVYSAKDRQEEPMRLRRVRVADGTVTIATSPEPLSRGDTWPRFSPDGKHLAFIRSDRGTTRDVLVTDAAGDGQDTRRVAGGFTTSGGLAWAPDGESLILSATWRGPYELWRVPVTGGEPVLLPAKGQRPVHPDCGGDGTLVFVDSVLDLDLQIRRLDDPPADAAAVAPSTRLDTYGRFSPDGRSVLFVSERSGARELWLLDRASGAVRQVSAIAGDALRHPCWSPDGRRVAVGVTRDSRLQVVVVDVATGLQRQVTPADGHYRLGHWSDDGQWLYYSRESGARWQIGRVRVDGTGAADVDCPGCLTLREEPDGTLFYFKETAPGLFRRDPHGAETLLVVPEDDGATTDNVKVATDGIWFTRRRDGVEVLSFRAFGDAQARDVARLPEGATGEFDLSADGRELLISTVARSGADLVQVRWAASADQRQPR